MKSALRTYVFTLLFISHLCLLHADGLIIIDAPIPHGVAVRPGVPKPEALPVKYHHVKVEITNQVATTHIDQVFLNPHDRDLEGTYIFPLPEEAAISDFALYMDGQRVSGDVLEKEKARRIYEDIVRRMKDPGLLEYIGRNMFQARIYPIPARGERRIELTYHQTLKYDAGVVQYVYPLNTERFSPKPLDEVSLSVKVKSSVPIKTIYSPSHEVDVKLEKNEATCGFEEKNVRPDRDFVLYYTVSEKDLGLNLLTHKRPDADGFFMMLISPGKIDAPAQEKDIVFVLDTSGSMKGEKLAQVKDALRFCLKGLKKGDRFGLITFATAVNPLKDTLSEVNDAEIQSALKFVDVLEARGGTDINSALVKALEMLPESKRPRMVVFLTDGEPTIGVTNREDILKHVAEDNKTKARIFAFGVGDEVNTILLDKIADTQRGTVEYVKPGENIEIKVSSFFDKISEPVLTDLAIDYGKVKVTDIYPQTLPDLFYGSQITLMGRFSGEGVTAITLTGYLSGKKTSFVFEDNFKNTERENEFVPRLWATRKIGYLLSEMRLKGENKELIDEIVRLSREYGIITPYTSFLIVDKDEVPGRVANLPQGTRVPYFGIRAGDTTAGAPQMQALTMQMKSEVGHEAVTVSKSLRDLRESQFVAAPAEVKDRVKHVGGKTFYLRDEYWVDSAFKEGMKVKEVKYLSDEYFSLLKDKPELGKYFSAAEKIIIVFKGECYKIIE